MTTANLIKPVELDQQILHKLNENYQSNVDMKKMHEANNAEKMQVTDKDKEIKDAILAKIPKSDKERNNNLETVLQTVGISDPDTAQVATNIQNLLSQFNNNLSLNSDTTRTDQLNNSALLTQKAIMQQVNTYAQATSGEQLGLADLFGKSVSEQSNNLDAFINQFLNKKNPNILFLAMLAMLAAADVDAQIILSNNAQMMANTNKRKKLNDQLNAFQSFANVFPHTDADGKDITNLFDLFKAAYGKTPDPDLQAALKPFENLLKDYTDESGQPYWKTLTGADWDSGNVPNLNFIFDEMFNSFFTDINRNLNQIGANLIVPFTKGGSSSGGFYEVTSDALNKIVSGIQQGATTAGSISQDQNVIMQAAQQVYQTRFQGATTCLQLNGKVMDFIFSRV
jgi:hypothetical protein